MSTNPSGGSGAMLTLAGAGGNADPNQPANGDDVRDVDVGCSKYKTYRIYEKPLSP